MKRLLFISYFLFDPNMGAKRAQRITRAIPGFGYQPVLVTHDQMNPPNDLDLGGADVIRVSAVNLRETYAKLRKRSTDTPSSAETSKTIPSRKIGLSTMLNRWLMIPDKQVTWLKPAVKAAVAAHQDHPFDLVYASLEPRTNLLAAATLSRTLGIPSVLEYRDLWTGNPYYHLNQPTAFHRWMHRRLEKKALRSADAITCVSNGLADYLGRAYPSLTEGKLHRNYNFFDPAEFPVIKNETPSTDRPFTVTYAGGMYLDRNPFVFFEGMSLYVNENKLSPEDFRFVWLGKITGIEGINEKIRELNLEEYIHFKGFVPHQEALRQVCESDAVLVLQAPRDDVHIPGKLFEAMGAGTPVLALANPCEVTDIIDRTSCGVHCPYEPGRVRDAMDQLSVHRTRDFNEAEVRQFDIHHAVKKLAGLFDQVLIQHEAQN